MCIREYESTSGPNFNTGTPLNCRRAAAKSSLLLSSRPVEWRPLWPIKFSSPRCPDRHVYIRSSTSNACPGLSADLWVLDRPTIANKLAENDPKPIRLLCGLPSLHVGIIKLEVLIRHDHYHCLIIIFCFLYDCFS